jgi:hypothetical protein
LGRGETPAGSEANASGGRSNASTITGAIKGDTPKMNFRGEAHCYNCGGTDHWAYECPHLSNKQQQQLHMNSDAQDQVEEVQKEGQQLLNVTFLQRGSATIQQGIPGGMLNGHSTRRASI